MDNLSEDSGRKLEQDYVRDTYNLIADEFSGTRYKKWPQVEKFLSELPPGSLVLDVGCGNGKYLDISQSINIGCDISSGLLAICRSRGFEVLNCDMTKIPFRANQFDAIICIAALHHVATSRRRLECLQKIFDLLSCDDGNKLLIQVWSYEQEIVSDNPYIKKLHDTKLETDKIQTKEVPLGQGNIVMPVHKNRTPFTDQDLLVPFKTKRTTKDSSHNPSHQLVEHLRYYHVFKEGELDQLICSISNARIIKSYYDKGNWCAIVSKIKPSII